jgi:hypothetical protein
MQNFWCNSILLHVHVGSKFAALIIVRRIWIVVENWKVYLNWFCLYWIESMCVRWGPAVMAICPGIESRALRPGCNVLIARPYPMWQPRSSNNVQLRLLRSMVPYTSVIPCRNHLCQPGAGSYAWEALSNNKAKYPRVITWCVLLLYV